MHVTGFRLILYKAAGNLRGRIDSVSRERGEHVVRENWAEPTTLFQGSTRAAVPLTRSPKTSLTFRANHLSASRHSTQQPPHGRPRSSSVNCSQEFQQCDVRVSHLKASKAAPPFGGGVGSMSHNVEVSHSTIVLVLDLAACSGTHNTAKDRMKTFLDFCVAQILIYRSEKVAIFVIYGSSTTTKFAQLLCVSSDGLQNSLRGLIFASLKQLIQEAYTEDSGVPKVNSPSLSIALHTAICFIHALHGCEGRRNSRCARIVIFRTAPDPPDEYVSAMNAAFCAKLRAVRVDGVLLGHPDANPWLKQVVALTGGSLLLEQQTFSAVPRLFGKSRALRAAHNALDMRPCSFTENRQVNIGRACSACLALVTEQANMPSAPYPVGCCCSKLGDNTKD